MDGKGRTELFRLAVGIGFLVVVALFTALIAPYFVDWTNYKKEFEVEATKIFGQKVSVGGDAQIRLLPLPSMSFGDLSVGNNKDGTPLMSIDKFTANVELMPFLSGEVRVVNMNLLRPKINLQINENGTVAWTNRDELKIDPEHVQLDKVNVQGGRIDVHGFSDDRQLSVTDINSSLSAKSLIGPWRITGTGTLNSSAIVFDVATGRVRDDGGMRLKLNLRDVDQPYRLLLDGPIGLKEEILEWNGEFQIDPATNTDSDATTFSSKTALPVRTTGKFVLNPSRLEVAEFSSDIGSKEDPFTISGRGSVNLLEDIFFRFQIDGRQVDIDRIAGMQGASTTSDLNERIAIAKSVIDQIPVPYFDGEIDFEIPAIVAGDTVIREVSALVSPISNGWDIRRVTAKLPGATQLEANGRLGLHEDFGFDGHMLLATRQPTGFAAWAVGKVDPNLRSLTSGGIEADVTFTPNQTTFENMTLLLGDRKLTGSLHRLVANKETQGDTARDAMVVSIKGDEIDVADLQAVLAFTGAANVDKIRDVDLDANIVASKLDGFDMTMRGVDLGFRMAAGELSVSKLNIDSFYGATLRNRGQIVDLLGKPKGNIKINLEAENVAELLTFAQERIGRNFLFDSLLNNPSLANDMKLQFEIDARPSKEISAGRVLIEGEIGGTKISSQIGFQADFANLNNARFDVSTDLNNDDPARLLSQLGIVELNAISQLTGAAMEGPLNIRIESVGTVSAGFSTILSAKNVGTSVAANGLLYFVERQDGEKGYALSKYEMDVTAGFEDASAFLSFMHPQFPDFLGGVGDALALSARGHVSYENDLTKFNDLVVQLNDNFIDGKLEYKLADTGRKSLNGTLNMERLELSNLLQAAFGTNDGGLGDLTEGWSKVEFSSPLFKGYDAKIELSANKVTSGFDLNFNDAKTTLSLTDGEFELRQFIFGFMGGQVSGDATISNKEGTGFVQGQLFLSNLSSSGVLAHFNGPDVVQGNLTGNGTFNASGKTALGLINSLSGSGIIELDNAQLRGISASGLKSVLAASELDGFEIDVASVDLLIRTHFLNGLLDIPKISTAYSIAKGSMQVRNLVIESEGFEITSNNAVSFANGAVSGSLQLLVDPGVEKVSGGTSGFQLKWKGPLDQPKLEIDSQSMQGFLSIRAFEAEQRRVELLQAQILEKQRLRREAVTINRKIAYRDELRAERLRREEEKRLEALRVQQAQEEEQETKRQEAEARRLDEERRRQKEVQLLEEARIAEETRLEHERRQAELEALRIQKEKDRINALPLAETQSAPN